MKKFTPLLTASTAAFLLGSTAFAADPDLLVFDWAGFEDQSLIEAICKDYEGPKPTKRQTNPHPKASLAYATWVIARLGGWTGYYGKPGPQTLNRGLRKYHNIKIGTKIARRLV